MKNQNEADSSPVVSKLSLLRKWGGQAPASLHMLSIQEWNNNDSFCYLQAQELINLIQSIAILII